MSPRPGPLLRGPLKPEVSRNDRPSPVLSRHCGPDSDSRCLRIALLGYRSNPYCGGQGIYLRYLSQALAQLGHQVDVISGEPYPELTPEVSLIPLPGLNLYSYTKPNQGLKDRGLHSITDVLEYASFISGGFPEPYTFIRRLIQYFRTQGPDYDIIHDNQSLGSGLSSLLKSGWPVVSTIHHPITRDLNLALANEPKWGMRLFIRRWHRFLAMQKRIAPRLNRIITVSEQSKKDLIQDFRLRSDKIDVVLNGVDTQTFAPRPEIQRTPHRIMATASADVPLKGLIHLLKAVSELIPDIPDLELVVLGRPKDNGPTARLLNQSGLHRHVRFVHGLSTDQLVTEYAKSSLAVVPSLYEGFGLPAAEAMACGVPVIATDAGGLPEVVGNAGCIVPPANSQVLAAVIKSLLGNPESLYSLGLNGRQRMLTKFTWKRAAEETVDVYRKVIEG
ncbi:MAG: glycosyltransferase family 4 protein [Desulfovermiculus sp.]|nr:glycosyltransferase family 4 protein [Desulfovermiculus sp.]